MLRVCNWVESFRCAGVLYCNGELGTLRIENIWNFATFNLYTVPAKILISKGVQPIFEIFPSARRYWGCAFGLKVSVTQVFYFCSGKVIICAWTTFEILPISTCILCQQKSYVSKGIEPIFEIFASARRSWGWIFAWKVSGAQVFYLAMASWELCALTTFEILPLLTCTLWQQKSCISKGIQPIYEIFASAQRCWRWAFGWKVSVTQVFCFCNGKVKTLHIVNIWYFATFNLYSVPAKILYLQRYWTDFRKLRLSSKMLRVGIRMGGKFQLHRYFTFAMAKWKLAHIQFVSKNPISPKVLNRF